MKKGFLIAAICVAFGLQTISAQDTEVKSHGDLFQGMSRTIPQGRVVLPYGLEVTFEKTVHLIFSGSHKICGFRLVKHYCRTS